MKHLSQAEHYKRLNRKPSAAAALFFDTEGKILVIEPTYRKDWLLPGGSIEQAESPREACMREIKEELGLDVVVDRLLVHSYTRHVKDGRESYQMVFYGGELSTEVIKTISTPSDEIKNFHFVTLEEALPLVSLGTQVRLPKAIEAFHSKAIMYYEDERD